MKEEAIKKTTRPAGKRGLKPDNWLWMIVACRAD
jgi:hypothetical protein